MRMSEPTPKKNRRYASFGFSVMRQVLGILAVFAVVAVVIAGVDYFGGGGGQGQIVAQSPATESTPAGPVCEVTDKASLAPASGVLFGVNLDSHARSLEGYAFDLGRKPAVSVSFAPFPYGEEDKRDLEREVIQIRTHGQMMLLTLNPDAGLAGVTAETANALAFDLARFNADGVPVIVRFAPDMNGSWYSWGQQPTSYIAAFRTVAAAVHEHAPGSAVMWAPSYGGGYPYTGGKFEAKAGTPDFSVLDTNADGALNENDDSYAPYYPGDDAVDWVGLALFHWGNVIPWGENEVPEPGKFAAQLTGSYIGTNGDDSPVPDFYQVYGVGHGKPVAVPETAALFTPNAAGEGELAIKQAWWSQVFDPATAAQFPQLKMINWFEWDREETEVGARVDWTVNKTPAIREAFKAALPDWLRYGPAQSCSPRG
jgi:hypothetical protein